MRWKTVFYILVVIISILAFGCCFYLVTQVFRGFWSRHETLLAGLFGAFGSVVGGSLTLVGVKMTFTSQNKSEFVRLFPERLIIAEDIIELFTIRESTLREHIANESFGLLSSNEIIIKKQEHRLNAAKISAEFYTLVNDFLEALQVFHDKVDSAMISRRLSGISGYDYHRQQLDIYDKLLNRMRGRILLLTTVVFELKSKYKKYSKV